MVTRADVVAEARTWIGTPYVHQGRMKGIGADCACLPICVGLALGIFKIGFDVRCYAREPSYSSFLALCDEHMIRVSGNNIIHGYVLALRLPNAQHHVAIVADYVHGGLSIIHALGTTDGKGNVVEQRLSVDMLAKMVRVYALPGLSDA